MQQQTQDLMQQSGLNHSCHCNQENQKQQSQRYQWCMELQQRRKQLSILQRMQHAYLLCPTWVCRLQAARSLDATLCSSVTMSPAQSKVLTGMLSFG
jgi:hypothetical protein